MKKALIAGGALLAVLAAALLLVLAARRGGDEKRPGEAGAAAPAAETAIAEVPSSTPTAAPAERGFLYGRVTTTDGTVYQGRLRWGGAEEAFWSDQFNGRKAENRWAAEVTPELLPIETRSIALFGVELIRRQRPVDLSRPFMARFGDLARIEAAGRDLRVTAKSGTLFHLDRYEADDLADGLRVWDARHGVVDLDERRIRAVEFLPTPPLGEVPERLHGTVHTRRGEVFRGAVQWNRELGVGTDALEGRTPDGWQSLPFDLLAAIARRPPESVHLTFRDGREIVLSGSPGFGDGNRGLYVDDRRYGRVLVSWDVFERLDLSPGDSGPAYADFPPGSPLTGSVTTRDGRRLAGRLVYDLDESETIETLDAPSRGVDYTLPFGLVAAIVLPGGADDARDARVTLHNGEELRLEREGDLGEGNAGLLVFAADGEEPEYVPWSEVARVDLERPPASYPPTAGPAVAVTPPEL